MRFKLYFLLFVSGLVNDCLLTSYYIHAARGHAGTCTLLAFAQQVLAIYQARRTFTGIEPGSREQLYRMVAVAAGYVAAAYITVSRV